MEFVHQPALGVRDVLGDFLHEGLVIEAMDRFKFPILAGDLES